MLQIQMLGNFCIQSGGVPLANLNQPPEQSLLVFLILHREAPQVRFTLASLFWPDSPEGQAHTNLRNLVHLLRHALPEGERWILATTQTLQWNPAAAIQVDVLEFLDCLGEDIQKSPLENLERALCLYRGDLLPGCYDEWIEGERTRLRWGFAGLLSELTQRYESLRRYPQAAACAQQWVELEPLQKDGYIKSMQLAAISGDISRVGKIYRDYTKILELELGIAPETDIHDLYTQLSHPAKKNQAGAGRDLPSYNILPLVGRNPEWQAVQALWETASSGRPRMLVLSGEAGIGKSRLAEELLGWAARLGIRTAAAHCYATEGSLPYAPVVTWLRALGVASLEKVWLGELSRLMPELLPNRRDMPAPLKEAWQRIRLFEALARAVLGKKHPAILMIDDLQWGDQDTLEWLHYLLRFDPHAPLLVVGTLRSEEAESNPACTLLLSGLEQEGSCLEIALSPLSEAETGQLASQVAGKTLEHAVGALIYQETEGNPLFIVETVRAELFKQSRLPGVQPLPYKTRAVLENRIRQLSPAAHEMVFLAATIGRAFSLDVLRQASSAPESALIKTLDEMLQRRIVREMAQDYFDFSHARLREAALAGVSGAHRQMLHRQVAHALTSLVNPDQESKSGEIASHYEQAGLPGPAIQYYQAAAEEARKVFANELAIQYYQRALSLGETRLAGSSAQTLPPAELALLYEKLGDVQVLVGKFSQAQDAFELALAQSTSLPGLLRAQIFRKISAVLTQPGQQSQAFAKLDLAEQALGQLAGKETLAEHQEWIQIQLGRSNLLYWGDHPERMFSILDNLQPIVVAGGRPDQQVELLGQQFMARLRKERFRPSAETVEIARRRLALVETLGVPYDIAWAQFHIGFGLLWHGEPAAGREWILKAYDAAQRMGAQLLLLRSLAYLCILNRQIGNTHALREQSPRLFDLASAMGETPYQGISRANQGWLAWRDGDLASAARLCESAREIWKQSNWMMLCWLADWVLLAVAVARRDLPLAEQYALALLDNNPLAQPVLEPVARKLEEALTACRARNAETSFQVFSQALEMVKTSGDL